MASTVSPERVKIKATNRRALLGWALFDWANQPYFTLITTFIFAPYFVTGVVGDAVRGQTLWAWMQFSAGLLIALGAPVLGAIGDARGRRKPWIAGASAMAMVAMASLWLAEPGGPQLPVLIAVVIAAIGVEIAVVFNNAMLPGLVAPGHLGRLSGFGWGLGYVGGLIALFIVVWGFAQPWAGLDTSRFEPARMSGPLSAAWLGVFLIPLMLFTPDAPAGNQRLGQALITGLGNLRETLRRASGIRNIVRFLVARMLYADGLAAIFGFGGIYAAGIFGWDTQTLGMFGIILIIFSMAGAFAGGWLDDRIGSKPTIVIALCGLMIGVTGILSLSAEAVLFVVPTAPAAPGAGLFSTTGERFMIGFSALVGLCGGPVQAASRTLLARLAPPGRTGAFFGLYALSGKATAFLAPLLVGLFTTLFASQRAGLAAVMLFLAAGLGLLLRVRGPARPDVAGPSNGGSDACR